MEQGRQGQPQHSKPWSCPSQLAFRPQVGLLVAAAQRLAFSAGLVATHHLEIEILTELSHQVIQRPAAVGGTAEG